ncbi:putative cellulase (glycosyl hydrolase family 5) [Lyophyllum shimeji]|uniref:mannan endo-1,4-beta-mannosidase n=1 Tax=Lyophyllum shimeji TaxID=47721 RepID=A0A9P3PJ06_LYOSH|nr:putative cellulase (glycosyl hydrolase family 5) [Lyophyllum shimeji]
MRLSLLPVLCALISTAVAAKSVPKGFVTRKGSRFELDGKPFYFVGANSYWLPLLTTQEDVENTFKEMQGVGVKVLRTWGFNAINATELAGATQSGLTYYQVWNSSDWTLNDGPQGLQRLDNVIATAGRYGIKVILAFTNNWVGYGGAELYINWIAGAGNTHDVFYTDPRIISSYQRYVKTIVDRYKNSSTIFAWELMNEARCLGDLPAGPHCVPGSGTLHTWYKRQSDFVRSLDPHHLITTGGEGHFYWKRPVGYWLNGTFVSDYNFNGQAGEDFDADMQLENIDFGTYHLYPQFWYPELDTPDSNFTIESWGSGWIKDHALAAKKAGKPVILEEFGVSGLANKTHIYPEWVDLALASDHAILISIGTVGLKENGGNRLIKYADALIDGASPNDGFAIYKNQTAVWNLFTRAARIQAAKSV